MLIQKNPNKTSKRGRANLCSTPTADFISCHCLLSHWARKRFIMLFKTEICHENKISFYKGPYYFNMLYNTSLIFLHAWSYSWIKWYTRDWNVFQFLQLAFCLNRLFCSHITLITEVILAQRRSRLAGRLGKPNKPCSTSGKPGWQTK